MRKLNLGYNYRCSGHSSMDPSSQRVAARKLGSSTWRASSWSILILRANTLAWEENDNRGIGQGLEAKEILGLERARARLGLAKGLGTGVSTTPFVGDDPRRPGIALKAPVFPLQLLWTDVGVTVPGTWGAADAGSGPLCMCRACEAARWVNPLTLALPPPLVALIASTERRSADWRRGFHHDCRKSRQPDSPTHGENIMTRHMFTIFRTPGASSGADNLVRVLL